jgi:site-specific recombinase XerD
LYLKEIVPMTPIPDYIQHLILAGKQETARNARSALGRYAAWLTGRNLSPLTVTTVDLRAYQRFLAEDYRSPSGRPLGRGTQATRLAVVKSFHAWMERRGLVVADVARHLELTWQAKGPVRRDYLTLQEATALLQTKAATAAQYPEGCARWATEIRDLTFLSLALATGRRRSGLRELRLANVDTERNEIRIEREKGRTGRVLPVASWAMAVVKTYRDRSRPILCWQRDNDAFFPGERTPLLGKNTIHEILHRAHAETVAAHPDLTELATKRLSPHSLRVSFAHLIFQGGANIRTINELMLHQQLGTTSRYVPVPLDDLRRACASAHPRA